MLKESDMKSFLKLDTSQVKYINYLENSYLVRWNQGDFF